MTLHILGGSLELEGDFIQAGILQGSHEFDIKDMENNVRYVRGHVRKMNKGELVKDFLFRIYDNSTGSLVSGDFNDDGKFQ